MSIRVAFYQLCSRCCRMFSFHALTNTCCVEEPFVLCNTKSGQNLYKSMSEAGLTRPAIYKISFLNLNAPWRVSAALIPMLLQQFLPSPITASSPTG
jgi:hypothetical protein